MCGQCKYALSASLNNFRTYAHVRFFYAQKLTEEIQNDYHRHSYKKRAELQR